LKKHQTDQKKTPRNSVLGVGISVLNIKSATQKIIAACLQGSFSGYVTVTGVHGVMESQRCAKTKEIHNASFLTTPDGMPMVWLGKWNGHSDIERVYGPELMENILDQGRQSNMKHFLWGGGEGVAQELKTKLTERFSDLLIVDTETPPYRALTDIESEELMQRIEKQAPHCFWVGLSTPKQEAFMHHFINTYTERLLNLGHGIVFLGVGAAFDFHSGNVKQAPRFIQKSGMEWAFRLCCEPKRLWKRYLVNNTLFLAKIVPSIMYKKLFKRG